jgi:endonuclease YncB( thermonuclease family)
LHDYTNALMRLRYKVLTLVAALLLAAALVAAVQELVRAKRLIDGNTSVLESGEHVHRFGVNAPEVNQPKRSVEPFGKAVADFTRRMVEGKLVRIDRDVAASKKG